MISLFDENLSAGVLENQCAVSMVNWYRWSKKKLHSFRNNSKPFIKERRYIIKVLHINRVIKGVRTREEIRPIG